MRKKLFRLLSLALAFLLMAAAVAPGPVSAVATTSDEIRQQIKQIYRKAQVYCGQTSFDGQCGTLTGVQLYLLGITSRVSLQDGKEGYDTYCRQEITSGGYRVRAYSGKKWSLQEALNDITRNGTINAYNILVGFESTPSALGQRYGHSCVIHAIVDGRVYFVESYDATLNGKRYAEGSPLSCTIGEFCDYYRKTTTAFDGVIHFGLKTYAELCQEYPANFYASATKVTQLRSQPCTEEVDSGSKEICTLVAGEQLRVTGVCLNTQGEYWYRVEGRRGGYVLAEDAQVRQFLYDDVAAKDLRVPTVIPQGSPFYVAGELTAEYNTIYTLRAQVYSLNGGTPEQVIGSTDVADSKIYTLSGSAISRELTFRKLTPGSYRYALAAVVGNYHVLQGQLQVEWNTVELWTSDFRVTAEKADAALITYDPGDGVVSVQQTALERGESLGTLPTPRLPNYVFLGWYTGKEGGRRVTEDYIPEGDMTLYARWYSAQELYNSRTDAGECWYFYADGQSSMGCMEVDGTLYYFSIPDTFGENGIVWATTE